MKKKYAGYPNILILGHIYNTENINLLRSNCKLYIHGHSVGGTNPSLVEAMNLHLPIIAFDVIYNKETTENKALYFKDIAALLNLINTLNISKLNEIADAMKEIAERRYKWATICKKYESLFL